MSSSAWRLKGSVGLAGSYCYKLLLVLDCNLMFSINHHPSNLHTKKGMSPQGPSAAVSPPPPVLLTQPSGLVTPDSRRSLTREEVFRVFTKHRSKMPIEAAMSEVMQRFVAGVRRAQIAFFVAFSPGLNLRVGEFSL